MTERVSDRLCKGLELAEKNAAFFVEAAEGCEQGPGREVFSYLAEAERDNMQVLEDIYDKMKTGESFSGACTMSGLVDSDRSAADILQEAAQDHGVPDSCTSELGAVTAGHDVLEQTVAFYEDWADEASEDLEQEFAARLLGESRNRLAALADLQYYYQDPEGWALGQAHGGLDGA